MSKPFFNETIRNELLELMSADDLKEMDQELHTQLEEMLPASNNHLVLPIGPRCTSWHKVAAPVRCWVPRPWHPRCGKCSRAIDKKAGDIEQVRQMAVEAKRLLPKQVELSVATCIGPACSVLSASEHWLPSLPA